MSYDRRQAYQRQVVADKAAWDRMFTGYSCGGGTEPTIEAYTVLGMWDGNAYGIDLRLVLVTDPLDSGYSLGPGDRREHTFPWRHRREPVTIIFTADERMVFECQTQPARLAFIRWFKRRRAYLKRCKSKGDTP